MPDPLNVTDSHPGMVVNIPNTFFIGVGVSADPQDTTVTQSSAPAAPVTAGATTRLTYLGGLSDLLSKGGVLPK